MVCADYVINLETRLLYSAIQLGNWKDLAGWRRSGTVSVTGGKKCTLICGCGMWRQGERNQV